MTPGERGVDAGLVKRQPQCESEDDVRENRLHVHPAGDLEGDDEGGGDHHRSAVEIVGDRRWR